MCRLRTSSCNPRICSLKSIPRLNPLHPHLVPKALLVQRKELHRCHQVWRKPFNGTATEREEYRKEIRKLLKRQMEEKSAQVKLQRISKANEAEHLLEVDRLALSSEKQQNIQHSKALTAYRHENKRLMERSWRDRALTRSQEALKERELLHLNPINWSGTLK
uniref:Uncharacterized protein n=1 Tax=Nothobranchius furzeri TaxID=105023 RepID=A0A8C6PLN4_NOTFU